MVYLLSIIVFLILLFFSLFIYWKTDNLLAACAPGIAIFFGFMGLAICVEPLKALEATAYAERESAESHMRDASRQFVTDYLKSDSYDTARLPELITQTRERAKQHRDNAAALGERFNTQVESSLLGRLGVLTGQLPPVARTTVAH